MLSKQLLNIYNELDTLGKYDSQVILGITEFIDHYTGLYLYPRVIRRKFNIEMREIYDILSYFEKDKVLSLAYEVYCNQCNKFQDTIYHAINEIPKDINCEYCGKDLNSEDIIVIYKVNRNE